MIDGELSAGELHIVHQLVGAARDEHMLIIAALFELGEENKLLTTLGLSQSEIDDLPMPDYMATIPGPVDLKSAIEAPFQGDMYHYEGSLTTPPCSETVKWFVMATPLTVSELQVENFKALFPEPPKNRPPFPLGDRILVKNELTTIEQLDGWSYEDTVVWGRVSKTCAGEAQSPVNIKPREIAGIGEDVFAQYAKYSALPDRQLRNTGHALQVDGNFGRVTIGKDSYDMLRMSLHIPSEHQIDGENHAGELHLVHQKPGAEGNDAMLVVAVLFELGVEENGLLNQLGFRADLPEEKASIPDVVDLGPTLAPALNGDFYHYDGSLTEPPCSETVKWFVLAKPLRITQRQVDLFKARFPGDGNNRPAFDLGKRRIVKNHHTTNDPYGNTDVVIIPGIFTARHFGVGERIRRKFLKQHASLEESA